MKWISDYVNLDGINPKELAVKLTMSTAEVEEVIKKGEEIENVVVGKVTRVEDHPTSGKLKIAHVDIGGETIQSVCGAPNVAEGIYAPVAKIGGSIIGVPNVEKTSISGVESCGILCSGSEIGVIDSKDKLLLLDENLTPGTNLKEIYGIDDTIIEIDNKSLTHRPDLWGHYGIAREIAAILKRPLGPVKKTELPHDKNLPDLNIEIEDKDKCYRYSAIAVENVGEIETPLQIRMRLHYCDISVHSLLVDLSNYIMLDIGQPNHAFDHEYAQHIIVKCPPAPIKFWTLDGVERDIDEEVLMIYNKETPVAVAGVMGGEESEITEKTTSLLLESANFDAYTIRKGAAKIGLRTDASSRFEKSQDPALTSLAIERFIYLLQRIKPDMKITSNLSDLYVKQFPTIYIDMDKHYLDRYIGKELPYETVIDILERLEFKVRHTNGFFKVEVPPFRATRDINLKVDLVEEVTRIYGYDNIEPQTVELPLEPLQFNEERLFDHKVKEVLAETFGFNETHSYTWYDNDFNKRLGIEHRAKIELINPHAKEMNFLRTSIVPAMLMFAEKNVNQFPSLSLFEIGKVFYLDRRTKECDERKHLCILAADKQQSEDELFYRLKGIISHLLKLVKGIDLQYRPLESSYSFPWLHPEKSAIIHLDKQWLGYLSVLHPTVKQQLDKKLNIAVLEVSFNRVFTITGQPDTYNEISRYPEVSLDFSFLADRNTRFKEVDDHVAAFKHKLLLSCRYVMMYEGKNLPEGKKSLTFAFTLGSKERTLSTEDINQFLKELIAHMEKKGFVLRQG
jgi:phenylalanyl-tRNA synthetase beta chain